MIGTCVIPYWWSCDLSEEQDHKLAALLRYLLAVRLVDTRIILPE
jgi:hypothetical protein